MLLWVLLTGTGMAQSSVPSAGGGCVLNFNGVGNYVDMGIRSSLTDSITSELTMECWFYSMINTITPLLVYTASVDEKVFGNLDYTTSGYILGVYNNRIYPEIRDVSGQHISALVGQFVPFQWVHIAVTYKAHDSLKVYKNGEKVYSVSCSSKGNVKISAKNFSIGRASWTTAHDITGQMDEIRVWNRVLPQTEIQDNMCQRLTGSEQGLMGYWCFDECSGSIATDLSGHGNNGTLH